MAKLTPEKAKVMREIWRAGTVRSHAALGRLFRVSRNTANMVLYGELWPEAGGPILRRETKNREEIKL